MHRRSILHAAPRDPKRHKIGALEIFVLSCVDGASTAEQVAEAAGLEVGELLKLAQGLVELGALTVDGAKAKRRAPLRRTEYPSAPPPVAPTPMSLIPAAVAPVARAVPDLRSLGITAREGFILSQIDGATSMADLVAITHLSARDVSDALYALEAAGAIELPHRGPRAHDARSTRASKAPSAKATKAPPARATKAPTARATKAPPAKPTKAPPARATKAPPAKLTKAPPARATKAPPSRMTKAPPARATKAPPQKQQSMLPDAEHARIAEDAERIDGLDYYDALGVERDADAKAIRRAYHALARKFHPDRFFGKNLGPSRERLHRVFVRLTRAYETLSKKSTREEYDLTLPPRPSARAVPPPSPIPEPPPPPVVVVAPPPVVAPIAAPSVVTPISPRPAPPPPPAAVPSSADPLRATLSGKKRGAVQEHVDVFVRAAKEALERDDVVAAANNYRLAAQCSDDVDIRAALEVTEWKARARVRDTSLTAARVAEQSGRWAEAAAKYAKAHGVQPEAWIAERAANAMRHEAADLRRAAQLGEQAVLAEPNNASFRVTLGEIYFDAGLLARAAGESGRALALAPADPRANALARLVAKTKRV